MGVGVEVEVDGEELEDVVVFCSCGGVVECGSALVVDGVGVGTE